MDLTSENELTGIFTISIFPFFSSTFRLIDCEDSSFTNSLAISASDLASSSDFGFNLVSLKSIFLASFSPKTK